MGKDLSAIRLLAQGLLFRLMGGLFLPCFDQHRAKNDKFGQSRLGVCIFQTYNIISVESRRLDKQSLINQKYGLWDKIRGAKMKNQIQTPEMD